MTLRQRDAGGLQQGREDVDHVHRLMHDAGALDRPRPGCHQRRGDAALVDPVLEQPERRVGGVGPRQVITLKRVVGTGCHRRRVADAHGPAVRGRYVVAERLGGSALLGQELRAAAVVGQEQHQGVFRHAGAPQRRHDAADATVHAFDLRGVDRHAQVLPHRFARLAPGPRVRVARRDRPAPVEHAHALQLLVAGTAQRVPAVAVAPLAAGDIVRQRVQRPVRRRVGDVEEERRMPGGRLLHHRRRGVADGVGEVVGLRLGGGIDELPVAHHGGWVEVAAATADHAVVGVEATLHRERMAGSTRPPGLRAIRLVAAADVPLAGHHGAVAAALQRLGNGDAVVAQVSLVLAEAVVAHHVAHPGLVRIEPGEQRRARRTAARAVVGLREAQPGSRQGVQVRRTDLRAITTDVRESQVIRQDHHEIGPPRGVYAIRHAGSLRFVPPVDKRTLLLRP